MEKAMMTSPVSSSNGSSSVMAPLLTPRSSPRAVVVPYALLALYFLHAFILTFPMTAYGEWLFQVIHMPPATTTLYYSMSFFPWNLKPLYGLISDNFPIAGYHRKSYIMLCEVGAALSLLVTGTCIASVSGAFVVKILDAVFEAFAQIMLGIFLVDLASWDSTSVSSARVQSWANGAKNAASILALVMGIPIYQDKSIAPQSVIAWTSVFPLVAVVICLFGLREARRAPPSMDVELSSEDSSSSSRWSLRWWRRFQDAWVAFKADATAKLRVMKPVVPTMLFFCLSSALPSDGSVWYQYTFSLLGDQLECLQYGSLAGMVGRFVSCLMYARICSGRNVRHVFLASTVSCVLAGLPRLLLTPPVAALPISICAFSTLESFVTAFTAEFALLQLLVVATFYCPRDKKLHGLTYALYLSFMDFGGVLSGIFSSMVVTALGIVPDQVTKLVDWDQLWLLVLLSAGGQLCVLLFLYVLPEKAAIVEAEATQQQREHSMGTEYEPLLVSDGHDRSTA